MKLEPLHAGDIYVGMTLPFDVYDRNRRLLVSRGLVITSEVLSEKLNERGMFADSFELQSARDRTAMLVGGQGAAPPVKRTSVSIFQLLNEGQSELATLLAESPARAHFDRAILGIAASVQNACRLDSDAAIAGIFLDKHGTYPLRHAVNTAVLVELVMRNINPDAGQRLSALAAALTMDIAMLDLKEALYHQSAPPNDAQMQAIRAHPAAGVEWLKRAGVGDTAWLNAVDQHHELFNGTGYPRRVAGESLTREARAIELAQRYCAMVSERSYRPRMPSGAVFKKLIENKQSWDPMLGALLAREIGACPPGSYVRLAKGEIAIVLKRTAKSGQPVVRVLISAEGRKLEGFPKRNTREPNFQITGAVAPADVKVEHDFRTLWDLTTIADTSPDIKVGNEAALA
jgi:HD-GYP domain-containing protein (c-di-GMP phosphodiesterase class II)